MSEIPNHVSPTYSDESRDDALFHYTSADGLMGILLSREIWSTAYYCSNDESELTTGTGLLTPKFSEITHNMIEEKAPLVRTFANRGVDIREYARSFEKNLISHVFGTLCAYITCFCKPIHEEDFKHGLLSQWRTYGLDGGYALQFSRKKLHEAIEETNKERDFHYKIHDVYYSNDNPMKAEVLEHIDPYIQAYRRHLEYLGRPLQDLFDLPPMPNPAAGLGERSLESLLDYLMHTKNQHFVEEKEYRLSLIEPVVSESETLPTHYFSRNGLVVPYKKTPKSTFRILDCIEWIIIGPNPRMRARFRSVSQMIQTMGLSIAVRPSHIPFVRG